MKLISICAGLAMVLATPVLSTTFSYDIVLDSVSGDGPDVGFFQTQSPGATGTATAEVDETITDPDFLREDAFFTAQLIAGSAQTFFLKDLDFDGAAGVLSVSGSLGGLTGTLPGISFISAETFEFIYSGDPGVGGISTGTDLVAFLATVDDVSGFFSGSLERTDDATFVSQSVSFSGAPSVIPLPAGAVLLISGLGVLALRRRGAG